MKHPYKHTLTVLICAALGFPSTGCGKPAQEHTTEHGSAHWSYLGDTSPEHWGDLSPAFALCKTGKQQSPIDLPTSMAMAEGSNLVFEYQSTPLNLVNNGHTIKQTMPPGSFLRIQDKSYQLLQFHFHSRSEHTVDGERMDLEMHLVHQSAAGEFAVVSILFRDGQENAFLKTFWDRLPSEEGTHVQDSAVGIDIALALPSDRVHFAYDGSFTTPPGTEGVKWHVFREVMECSSEQLAAFRMEYADNFRPVQKLNGRVVQLLP